MICQKCGTEFSEGIFCPECGSKHDPEKAKMEASQNELELQRQKTEQERLAKERVKHEAELAKIRLEQEKLEFEKETQRKKFETEEKLRIEAEKKSKQEQKAQQKTEKKEDTMSIWSLVCGIISICSFGCLIFPQILGIVFALCSKKQGQMLGLAKIGLLLSILSFIISVVVTILAISLP